MAAVMTRIEKWTKQVSAFIAVMRQHLQFVEIANVKKTSLPSYRCVVWMIIFVMASIPSQAQQPEADYFPDLEKPMEFRDAATGGNCQSCSWIAAQGVITGETPSAFEAFLDQGDYPEGISIHLNSFGGDLGAALRLGRMIRKRGYNTVVAETAGYISEHADHMVFDQFLDTDNPVCASACVFAFVGGINRAASKRTDGEETGYQKIGRLAVHQFYSFSRNSDVFDSSERIMDQVRTAALLEYLVEMGISADLLARALAVPPDQEMYQLTEEDLVAYGIETFRSDIHPQLLGYPNGVGIVEIRKNSRRGNYRYEFFCDNKKQAMLKLSISDSEVDLNQEVGPNDLFDPREYLRELNIPLPGTPQLISASQSSSQEGSKRVLEAIYLGKGSTVSDLIGKTSFEFENSHSSYHAFLAADMSFRLPESFSGFYLLPRLCLD